MTTIKSYTDLQQSKKLTEILPLESADMVYICIDMGRKWINVPRFIEDVSNHTDDYDIYAWSLAALLRVLTENKICHYDDRYYCQYMSEGDEFPIYSTAEYDNPVDACVAMIEHLHELKIL